MQTEPKGENKNLRADDFMVLKFDTNKVPTFKEDKKFDWIVYGTDQEFYNRYPDFLLQLYNRSSTHCAIINGLVHYCCGNGIEIDNTGLKADQKSILQEDIKQTNSYGETLSELLLKSFTDKYIHGGFYLEILWNKSGKDFDICHMDYGSLRLDKSEEGFWYSNDWKKAANKQSKEETGLEYIPLFDMNNRKGKQILWYKDYRPGLKWYPLPSYLGSVQYIEIDYEISNFHLSNIRSGFNISTIISFNNGKPDPEQRQAIQDKLIERFTTTDKAGGILVNFSLNKENAPTINRLTPSDLDKQFEILTKQTQNNIFIGHKITNPALMGVKSEAGLGSDRTTIATDYELFKSTVIKPEQKKIEDFFNKIYEIKGFGGRIKLKEVSPINETLTEATLKTVLTTNELRDLAGYEKIDGGDTVVGLTPPKTDAPIEKPVISSAIHHFEECCSPELPPLGTEKFKSMKKAIDSFKKYAKPKDKYEILRSKQGNFASTEEWANEERVALGDYCFGILDSENVSNLYKGILDLINKDPLLDAKEIAKALNIDEAKVNTAINKLTAQGAIESTHVVEGGDKISHKVISDKAEAVLEEQPAKLDQFQVLYSYEPRTGLEPVIKTSRDFCKELIDINGMYKRSDIAAISDEVGWNVWVHRGGFWHKKGTDMTYPYCRHTWNQHIVKLK